MLIPAMLAAAEPPYEPPAELWYPQAVACGASAFVAKDKVPKPGEIEEILTYGMIMAEVGRTLGRTPEQVEDDVKVATAFYRHLQDKKAKAFAAHRTYCRALLDADRP